MRRSFVAVAAVAAALLFAGCAAYHAEPIDPAKTDAAFRSRTLSDPRLLQFVEQHSRHVTTAPTAATQPVVLWDVNTLTLAAQFYRADLAAVRADARAAEAAIQTAEAHPNPTLAIGPGWESDPAFPFIIDASLDWPIETAGKRGYRIKQAKATAAAARWQVAQTIWELRSRVRAALLEDVAAQQSAEAIRNGAQARTEVVDLLSQRLAAGAISRPELDRARIDANDAQLSVQEAIRRRSEARSTLAAAIGVPGQALQQLLVQWPNLADLPSEDKIPSASVQQAALLGRADIRKGLAEYAAADAALQLEIAKQYPDLQLSPGYAFDDGIHKYTLGASLTLPILNQNQGPIAEAEARRAAAAARFESLQAEVIGKSQRALARYRSALSVLATANRILALAEQRQRSVQQAFDVGREDRLALADAHVERAVAQAAQVNALNSAQAALGELEDAIERPLVSASPTTLPAASAPSSGPQSMNGADS